MPPSESKAEEDNDKSKEEYDSSSSSTPDLAGAEEEVEGEPEAPGVHDSPEKKKLSERVKLIENSTASTPLEIAYQDLCKNQQSQIERLHGEIRKLQAFISKRKQTYKRKRKDEGAPTRPLSAYNLYVRDQFKKLHRENEDALHSKDTNLQLKRVPPASMVASTGKDWKDLPAEEKKKYTELAAADKKRYDEQMAKYTPPDTKETRKRNKTGYNMFFSAYVTQLKASAAGVPAERGSVARLVGNAWKELTSEEKQYYEVEAEKVNEAPSVETPPSSKSRSPNERSSSSPRTGATPRSDGSAVNEEWLSNSPSMPPPHPPHPPHYHGGPHDGPRPPHQQFDAYGYQFQGYYGHNPPGAHQQHPHLPPGHPPPPHQGRLGPPAMGPPPAGGGHYDQHHSGGPGGSFHEQHPRG